ncbi:hypothetical protein N9Y92_00270 [Chlamydiales bacterium]|nr:hypothetical protein [Chlamydiales bacterium]
MSRFFLIPVLVSLFGCCRPQPCPECPIPCGIPCTSLSEIDAMVIETPDGEPDIFTGQKIRGRKTPCKRRRSSCSSKKSDEIGRIWIEGSSNQKGDYIEGHYIYFNKNQRSQQCYQDS